MAQRPRAPPGSPLTGNLLRFARDPLRYLDAIRDAYRDPLIRLTGPSGELYVVLSPDLVRRVLVEGSDRYRKADVRPELMDALLGDGLLTSEGASWADQRQRLGPAFTPRAVRGYVDSIRTHTARLAGEWREEPDRDIHADMTDVAVRVIAETLLGTELDDDDVATVAATAGDIDDSFTPSVSRALLPSWVPGRRPERFDRAVGNLDALAERIIDAHRVPDPPEDIVTTLLEAVDASPSRAEPARSAGRAERDPIDGSRVRDEVVTILLAGHETTALVLTYAWFLLSREDDGSADRSGDRSGRSAADRLRAEVDALGGPPGMEDLGSLPYTDAVVNESMRLYPPVWALFREPKVGTRLGDYRVPAGTTVMLPQWAIHRDGRHFEDARSFRPERWLERKPAETPAFFPFGAGPRACIGRTFALVEARLVLATLAREFDVEVHRDEMELGVGITMRPEGPVEGRVTPRTR